MRAPHRRSPAEQHRTHPRLAPLDAARVHNTTLTPQPPPGRAHVAPSRPIIPAARYGLSSATLTDVKTRMVPARLRLQSPLDLVHSLSLKRLVRPAPDVRLLRRGPHAIPTATAA